MAVAATGFDPAITGSGTGDMLVANNLSELTATAATARTNIAAAPLASPTFTGTVTLPAVTGGGTVNLADNVLQRPELKDVGETVTAIGNTGAATKDLDLTTANVFTAKVTGAVTFTFSNPSPTTKCCALTLILENGSAFVTTWPGSVKWPGGVAPALTAAGFDVLTFITVDAGTTWRGAAAQLDSK